MSRKFRDLITRLTRRETRKHKADVMRRLERAGLRTPLTDEARERMKGKVDALITVNQV